MNIFSAILLLTALANLLLAIFSLRYRNSPGAIAYFLLLVAISLYSFGYAFELQSGQVETILFWLKIEYIGIAFIPSLLVMLAFSYTGRTQFLKPWILFILVLMGVLTYIFQYSNFHNLFYEEFQLIPSGNLTLADFTHGIWYWIHQILANCMLLISTILYLTMVTESSGINRKRASIMLISSVIPWAVYLIYITGHSPHNIDLSPFSFSLVGFLGALGVLRFHLLEYVPIALEHVYNSMTNGLIVIDNQGHLVSFNQSAARLFPQLSPARKGEFLDITALRLPAFPELADGFETNISMSGPEGEAYYHLHIVAVYNNRHNRMGKTIVITDVTDQLQKEKRLIEKEKRLKELNVSKDKFLAIIAHDLRNSFHLIINMTEMLISNVENQNHEGALKKGKIIYDTSVNTYHLLQNLLEWALIQQKGMHFTPVNMDITPLIDEEIRNLRTLYEQKDLTITHSSREQYMVKADMEMLKTVIRNLLSNAIKYSYPGGSIQVSSSYSSGNVTVAIADKGTGMTPEEQDLVFRGDGNLSKKGTAAESGTGLGLTLCQEFVRLHGGKIWVSSTPGEGSTFSFTLPSY